jgi:hypothetical protein
MNLSAALAERFTGQILSSEILLTETNIYQHQPKNFHSSTIAAQHDLSAIQVSGGSLAVY